MAQNIFVTQAKHHGRMKLVAPVAEKGKSRKKCNFIIMKRINVINESKFERMTPQQLQSIQGGMTGTGICISCKKRDRKIRIVVGTDESGETVH